MYILIFFIQDLEASVDSSVNIDGPCTNNEWVLDETGNISATTLGDLKRKISTMMWIINSLGSEVAEFLAYNGDLCDWDDLDILHDKIFKINEKNWGHFRFMFNVERKIQIALSKNLKCWNIVLYWS